MSEFTYWPYDEVSLSKKEDGDEILVMTPWLEARTSTVFFDESDLTTLQTKLRDKTLCIDDISLVSDFFQNFHKYPFSYILPMPKNGPPLDEHALVDDNFLTKSFSEMLVDIMKNDASSDEINDLTKRLARTHFEWDHEAALDFATCAGKVHPESIFSIARRYHIIEIMNNDHGTRIFDDIKNQTADDFKNAACLLVRQNHYVTKKCQEALNPALSRAGHSRSMVLQFIEAERGHDKILEKALFHLGKSPEEIPVTIQTRALMTILTYLAQRNFLAFAMAVDAFERNNFDDSDPIAKLLTHGGFHQAAQFINLHMKINDQGGHDNIAQQFLGYMNLCHRDYALEALRLMELLSVVMCSVSLSADV